MTKAASFMESIQVGGKIYSRLENFVNIFFGLLIVLTIVALSIKFLTGFDVQGWMVNSRILEVHKEILADTQEIPGTYGRIRTKVSNIRAGFCEFQIFLAKDTETFQEYPVFLSYPDRTETVPCSSK